MVKVINVGDFELMRNQMDGNAMRRADALDYKQVQIPSCGGLDASTLNCDVILHQFIDRQHGLTLTNLDKIKKSVLIMEDEHFHHVGVIEQFTDIILMYKELIPKWQEKYPDKHFHYIPHHVDHNLYKDLNLEKEYDVLVYGNMNPSFYPERPEIVKQLMVRGLSIRVLPYCDGVLTGEALVKEINKARFCLVTPSNIGYTVAKYFEIPMCGVIPIGIHTQTSKELYGNMLLTDGVTGDIAQQITVLKEDKELYNKFKEELKEIAQQYSLHEYKDKMEKLMREINDR